MNVKVKIYKIDYKIQRTKIGTDDNNKNKCKKIL